MIDVIRHSDLLTALVVIGSMLGTGVLFLIGLALADLFGGE